MERGMQYSHFIQNIDFLQNFINTKNVIRLHRSNQGCKKIKVKNIYANLIKLKILLIAI